MSVSRVRHHGQPPVPSGRARSRRRRSRPLERPRPGRRARAHAEVARIAHAEASSSPRSVGACLAAPGRSSAGWPPRPSARRGGPLTSTRRPRRSRAARSWTRSPAPMSGGRIAATSRRRSPERGHRRRPHESRRSIAVTPSPEPVTRRNPWPSSRRRPSNHAITRDAGAPRARGRHAAAPTRSDRRCLHAADVAREARQDEEASSRTKARWGDPTAADVLGLPAVDVDEELEDPEGPVVESASDHAETIPAGEPGRTAAETRRAVAAAGGGPGRPAYVARMLEAMVAAGGDFTAAAEALRIKRSSLVGSMSVLRSRTDLTEAEAAIAIARTRVRKA
jgi:hypothetical protein